MKKSKPITKLKWCKSFAVLAVSGLWLSGCAAYQPSYGPTVLRNKITVAETVERLELYGGPAGLRLSARDRDAIGQFIGQYAKSGQGPLYINVPSRGGQGGMQAQNLIRSQLGAMGLAGAQVQTGQYPSPPGVAAPVIVSYRRLAVEPIKCQAGAPLTQTSNNQPYGGFGCAQTANLAAMIDDPRQLLSPVPLDTTPAERHQTVMEKYVKGEATATPRPSGQEVTASSDGGGGPGG